ncbi:MAG: urease accessory protein UreD [Pseudomonadota bacterium]
MRKKQEGPLYVQRPFYPEGPELAHVYLLHPPGGLVSGDTLHTTLKVGEQAQVLCTTPGAGRLYRARQDRRSQQQINTLELAADSTLEWLPQESIVFEGAHAKLHTTVDLADSARFIGWEITALGLPASNALLTSGSLIQRLEINRHQRPLLREQLVLNDQTRELAMAQIGLQAFTVSGLFVCGPFTKEQLQSLAFDSLQAVRAEAERPALCGITRLGQFIVGRYLGSCAQQARMLFTNYWQQLRPLLLNRPACAPAIWAT